MTAFLAWHWWGHEGASMVVARFAGPTASADLMAAGQSGDLFGGFNALFASLAFVAASGALIFQASAMRAAQRQLALQAFEPLFLHLMEIHERIAQTVRIEMDFLDYENGQFYQRVVALEKAAATIAFELPTYNWFVGLRLQTIVSNEHRAKRLGEFYEGIYTDSSNEHALGPYFRSLYHIFKFIKNADLPYAQKVSYSNIARSTLGKGHLLLLALNCLSKYGGGFKPLVEEFGLLKHIAEHEPQGAESELEWLIVTWCYSPTARLSATEREQYWQAHPDERAPPKVL
ncbi:putative phage abortive infection protein [Variovorax sp. J22P168]|uniref:putative phage abortive infection protein n=1 Tax=Variovorax jilinensis TaxID=3053513 RepID=UPI0025773AF8|nr:putative phage abortive infection protein [Variovorax sp. J22P168]MDM0015096.1 putative phage abortive infection protein [Variovorax sp. J22P168]